MSEFQYVKTQRVIVPADRAGAEGVQGVITVNVARLGSEPHYEVQWPSCDTVGESGDLKMLCTDVSESELIKAQPPAMVSLSQARDMVEDALKRSVERASASRRRKASRSRKGR